MILLAVFDANYKFVWIGFGANGSASDAQLFNNCELKNLLEQDNLGLPPPSPLPGDDKKYSILLYRRWYFSTKNLDDETVLQT